MEPDWDLQAVVRGCTTSSAAAATSLAAADLGLDHPCFSSFGCEEIGSSFRFSDAFGTISNNSNSGVDELLDLYKPFCPNLRTLCPRNDLVSTGLSSVVAGFREKLQQTQQSLLPRQQPQELTQSQVIFGTSSSLISAIGLNRQSQTTTPNSASTTTQNQRSKKRKNLQKKVYHVPAEGLSSDKWAWRKYGQKPIKGSPYPRGYYRCSSSKGCSARKQVERNSSDPKMFIVTYTAEHNHPMPTHRNSLAGSTRQKPFTNQPTTAVGDAVATTITSPISGSSTTVQPSCSSPTDNLSPMTEKSESKTEYDDLMKDGDENEMGLSDVALNDDFFVGFEGLDDDTEDCFSTQFQASMEFPWLANSSGTATAAGGS
ncbi:hypothetical protein Nepgr_019116 [Nepenthes gracilis]|uniref:WRKY domain-containing protein n=1 Tax=Nepenthes gracilis TaxID=150966 RepID=A0AAD3SUM4_NEPGR|nr:hypothetical protein Nepgr_019116 [Nepenthes gracilis]